jgi:hypothetical protein
MLLSDDEFLCEGCDKVHSLNNLGGYRMLCDSCVDVMPKIPQGTSKGYHLEGKSPNFYWAEA